MQPIRHPQSMLTYAHETAPLDWRRAGGQEKKSSSLGEELTTFGHTVVARIRKNQVVQNLDAKEKAGLTEPHGDFKVVCGGFQVAAGVIMGNDARRSAMLDTNREHFSWMYEGAVDETD